MKKQEKKQELVKSKGNVPVNSPAEMIKMAVTGKADLDKLEKLLAIQERWDANEAKKAYHVAMAQFKANPPKIDKDKTVSFSTTTGKTSYDHASLANVTEKISEALSKCGLSASWKTQQNGNILVTCKITHVKGHSEETTLSAPADTSGSKNAIQAIGSTITYLERYTLLALTGLATYDQDDDGKATGAPIAYIDEKQIKQIKDLAVELNIDNKLFLDYMGIESLEKMPKSDFKKAMTAIETKRKAVKK